MFHRGHPLAALLLKVGFHVATHILKKKFADKLTGGDGDSSGSGVRVRKPSDR